jgi:membrane-bound lytic murein transglycosylase F
MADFKAAGDKYKLDWRLLAAMAYQESHWNPKAVSPTGVRGLMMLTRAAAQEVGIKNRNHPTSSIFGGAAYFTKQKARLPEYIPEPDRTWMALAAYNLGTQTVLRAITRTQKHGGNPTDWFDVQTHLSAFEDNIPTRAGVTYRKGANQGIHYVKHIRLFYDLLQRPTLLEDNDAPTPINLAMVSSGER